MDSNKKIHLTSKSQFNKNVRYELQNLNDLRKNNATSTVTFKNPSPVVQCECNSATEISNTSCNNNVSSILCPQLYEAENDSLILPTISYVQTFSLPDNVVNKDSSELENSTIISIPDQLRAWAIKNKITHVAFSELLLIQRQIPSLQNLPKCLRSFLNTQRKTVLRDINPGKYYHFGLENGIVSMLEKIDLSNMSAINIGINIEGLPLSDSSLSQVYLILYLITNVNILFSSNIFCVGIYHGYDKPSDFNDFLEEFVNEAINLTLNGIYIGTRHFNFKIVMLLFDAVVKASVLKIKGHNGYSSCSKCTQEGEYLNHVIFPDINFIKRTDEDFLN